MSENSISPPEEAIREEDSNELKRIRLDKLISLQNDGKDPFVITTANQSITNNEIRDRFQELENTDVSICGRIKTWRDMGKANFIDVYDRTGRMQVYVRMNDIGEEQYKEFKKWDIGDIVEVQGFVFLTKRGEISVHAKSIKLLSKSLLPLPEKYHGLTNTDIRYRQRYLDLIMTPEVKDTFFKRSQIIKEIRSFLDGRDFVEVETPMLTKNAGGAAARPFLTHHNSLDEDLKLRISLELYLKRLIIGGMERVYEIGRVFRNEGISVRHNPEFTLMELYQAYTDYNGMMELVESMIRHVAVKVLGTAKVIFDGVELDFEKPFEKITMIDAVKKYAGVDFTSITFEEAKALAKEKGIQVENRHKKGDILSMFFEEFCEKHLEQPTFVIDHPIENSPLAKKSPKNPELTERFELFISQREIANAYSELNDPVDQRTRFEAQEELLRQGDEEANQTDEDFLTAMEYGMPPTGGIGVGIDRLVMLLTDNTSIRDVLLFPTLKSLND
ncbi:MAG TPA: lysine--tRNA ligase [Clostridia bacterium]|nr:lysine--tRNA ligase [Clostridia bacterium]